MKNFLKLSLIFVCFLFHQLETYATVGGISSNGGDGIVSEFFDIARNIQKMLAHQNQKIVDVEIFAKTIDNAKVYSEEKVFLAGKEVSAINTPQLHEIRISQARWRALASTPKLKYILVLHEFLGLMGYEDRTFSISNQLLNGPGIMVSKVTCPFVRGSSIENSSAYTLELIEYRVDNYRDYRTAVYVNDLPDENSDTLSSSRMRINYSSAEIKAVIGTTGSALIMKDNPLSGGLMIHFEIWPGIPFSGTAFIQNDDPAEKVTFECTGSFD